MDFYATAMRVKESGRKGGYIATQITKMFLISYQVDCI